MRLTLLFQWVVGVVLSTASPALAGVCEDGATVTITAKFLSAFPNKAGQTTVNVSQMSPCETLLVLLNTRQPPASCRFGMLLTATGKVTDGFLGSIFTGDTFRCE